MTDLTLADKIRPYLNLNGTEGRCGMRIFPLVVTPVESATVLQGYLNYLSGQIETLYNAQKSVALAVWTDLNINVRTAVLEAIK